MATRRKRTKRKKATGRRRTTRKSTRGKSRKKAPRRKKAGSRKKTRRRRRNPAPLTKYKGKNFTEKQVAAGFAGPGNQKKLADRRGFYSSGMFSSTAVKKAKSGVVKSGAIKGKKKRKAPVRGKYSKARGGAAKKLKGRATYKTKKGTRRARPYRGRTKTVKLHKGYAMAPKRKRKLIKHGYLGAKGQVNPRKRRKKKKNPSFMGTVKTLVSKGYVREIAQTIGGISLAIVMPSVIENLSQGKIRNSGAQGLALTAGAVVVNTMAAGYVENWFAKRGKGGMILNGLTRKVLLGGGLVLATRALFHFAPQVAEWLKLSPVRTPVVNVRNSAVGGMLGMSGPVGDWVELSGMQGLGDYYGGDAMNGVTSNEALIAGESFAQSISQMGGMGLPEDRIPMGDIRAPGQALSGYPGQYGGGGYMGDWLETVDGSQLSMSSFDPGMQTF